MDEKLMDDSTIELMNQLDSEKNKKEVIDIQMTDPTFLLKTEMFKFFSDVLNSTKSKEIKENFLWEEIKKRIENGNPTDVTFYQLTDFFLNLQKQKNISNESILSLLRPSAPGTANPLLEQLTRGSKKQDEDEEFSAETQKIADSVWRKIQEQARKEKDSSSL
jgi:hypothetical protein